MAALFFPLEAGRLSLQLNCQRAFQDTAHLLLQRSCSPDVVLSTVVLMLQGGLLPSECQQMQALYLLGVASRASSLCGTVLLQAAGCEAVSPAVRGLALCLLAQGGRAVARLTPQEFMQTFDPGCVLSAPTLLDLQLGCLQGAGQGSGDAPPWLPDASAVRSAALPPAVAAALRELGVWADAAPSATDPASSAAADTARLAQALLQLLHSWAAALRACSIIRAAGAGGQQPAVRDPQQLQGGTPQQLISTQQQQEEEQQQQQPQPAPSAAPGPAPACDSTPPQDLARLQQLLGQAQRFPLLPGDQRQLVAGLKASAAAVVACQADLVQYQGLIENNPLVAAWLLIAINWHAQRAQTRGTGSAGEALPLQEELEALSKAIPNYLAVLCTLPMTNHSMECMTTLLDRAPPPPTVLAVFVANCVRTIESTQDASRQARLAKLLCAFLSQLLDRGQEGVVPAVYADVQSFCIAWSRLKEAAALFKRLKALESTEDGGPGTLGSVGSPPGR